MAHEISLCMIVKNEEENLPRCLESVKDIVDEMIIVDTGSSDKTVEIAKNYGAKIYYFEWCNDFSTARNESLKYATKDWIFIMDADDEFCKDDKEKFKMLVKNLDDDTVYFFETMCYFGVLSSNNMTINLNPRLFKNNYGYCYEGVIHNQLINKEHPIRGKEEPIKIYHYGYLDESLISKNKNKRNIAILEEQIKKNPQDKFNYFNLANEYSSIGNEEKALENYYKAYEEFDETTGFAPKLIERIVMSNYSLGYYNKAFEFIDIGLKYYPKFTDLYYLKGSMLAAQDRPTLAIKAFEKCMEIGEASGILKSIYGTGGFKASYELAQIYMKLKDYDTAYDYCVQTIRLKPDYLVPLYNIAHILKEKQTPLEEFKKSIENFFTDFPREYSIVADLFYMEGYYETALEYINKCEIETDISEELKFFKIKCLIRSSKFDECIEYTKNIYQDNVYYFQIMMYRIMCLIVMNKYELALKVINGFNENKLLEYNKKVFEVYIQFFNLISDNKTSILSEDESEIDYTSTMFEICEILLINKEFEKFEKALNLLNLVSDKSVLLQLGKLYNKHGYVDMAKKEIIRSIKLFDVIDREALDILKIDSI
ncbi:glycosyl transferase [Clostridium carboxidivorans P7]|uniref:Glycosyl transferase family 2 n=1 Tax=Clostridium carboxidivorans P7 TaxID=536227 RepID=C6PU12_9CLOT|nr:glycosyltransferase family 2 protein [Clostridium carboxidivorans]AKN33632.1 glycosyl transferase [Clostridium carboxidivorans P7]EET87311.1 glycosyl transferase family 2 [Clostridium carboxidivorans P7]EFG86776.1 glycosyltransferase, group 2 family protein [Clostridium carboxidivorans P7]